MDHAATSDEQGDELRRYLRVMRKRWWVIALALLVTMATAAIQTVRAPRIYRAETRLFVGVQQVSQDDLISGSAQLDLSSRLLESYAVAIATRPVAEAAVERATLPLTPAAVVEDLTATLEDGTHIVRVGFDSTDPALAQRVVTAVGDAFIERIEGFGVLEGAEPAVTVDVLEPAIEPTAPISPEPRRNMALALAFGLVLGVGLVLLIEALDRTVRSREDIEHLGLPLVGSIPSLDTHGADLYLERDAQEIGGEAFRKLRTAVGYLSADQEVQSVLITSTQAREGKTTVALNLAAAYALGGRHTLLVEADLRRPTLHKRFGMNGTKGLTTVIVGKLDIDAAIHPTDIRNLSVVTAGAIPSNPVELLGSDQMVDIVDRLYDTFDMVIIDSPPIAPVADPLALAPLTGGVILVTRSGHTDRKRVAEGAALIERAGGLLLGVVLNQQRIEDAPYEYAYYYSTRPPRRATSTKEPR